LSVGGHGLVSVAAHVVGEPLKAAIEAFATDPAKALRHYQSVAGVVKALFSAPSPVPVKYAASLNGFDCKSVRLPLVELSESEEAVVVGALEAYKKAALAVSA
jgi:4-hydroxy-tetrahydrodipicolinate synthase